MMTESTCDVIDEITELLEDEIRRCKARVKFYATRVRNTPTSKHDQEKLKEKERLLRSLRSSIFDAEDKMAECIEAIDHTLFEQFESLFQTANRAIKEWCERNKE